jgi:CRISPR-associated protein Cmr3
MIYRVNALDTLSFGAGKPSVRGEDTFGVGMFPPFPSVIRGAFRTARLSEHIAGIDVMNTDGDTTKGYTITQYALSLGGIPHFPAPADTVFRDEDSSLKLLGLRKNDELSSLELPYQLWADIDGKVAPPEGRYISLETLRSCLNDKITDIPSVPLSNYITAENRIGIYRERGTHTVKESMLFKTPLTRTEGKSGKLELIVGIDGIEPTSGGILRLGSHGKVAAFSQDGANLSWDGEISDGGVFKLYLATPAIFENGWYPTNDKLLNAELLASAVSGYDNIGGFDIKENHPKPMRRAVKAGSVYYFRLRENTEENRKGILALHGKSVSCERDGDGFGICYIGRVERGID